MRTSVTVRVEWDMGHRLPFHQGKCSRLHGHRYAAEVTVAGAVTAAEGQSDQGMVTDFGNLKRDVREWVDLRDHAFLVYSGDPLADALSSMPGGMVMHVVPTAENLAAGLYVHMRAKGWPTEGLKVKLYETPTASAEVAR